MHAARRRLLEWRRVLREVRDWAVRVRVKLGRVTAILYGSYARGDFNLWSDIDVILVSEAFEGTRFIDRWRLLEDTNEPLGVEAICWTPSEAKKMLEKPSWRAALQEGCVIILDDYGLAPSNCKSVEELIKRLEEKLASETPREHSID